MRRLARAGLALAVASALASAIAWIALPHVDLYGDTPFSQSIHARDGRLLRLGLARDERYRLRASLPAIAPSAVAATLLHEDRFFERHPGVNPVSLVRAAFATYAGAGRRQGASTLTMQLARLRFGLDTRSPLGKLQQIARALQLERHYEKRELLEAYLTLAPYGANVEGIAAASWIYFGKPAIDLTIDESLALAVIPQSPARRNPEHGTRELRSARDRLAARWADAHGIDATTRAALALPLAFRARSGLPFDAPHFVDAVSRRWPRASALSTTLDPDLQELVERVVSQYVERNAAVGVRNAAALLVETNGLRVRAHVGSARYFDDRIQGQVDGTRAPRSPGSALKPFVYALALDQGLIHSETMLADTPRSFGAFNPENFDRDFAGPLSARVALVRSRNVPAVDLAARLSDAGLYGLLERAQIAGLRPADFYGLGVALGGVELEMRELLALYAMLANDGIFRPLVTMRGAADVGGRRLLSPEASALTLRMLATNPPPGARLDHVWRATPEAEVAWKTGTSHGFRDAWAVGVFDGFGLAVWLGNFDGRGNPAFVGRDLAGPLFFEIVSALRARPTPERTRRPGFTSWRADLAPVEVCALSGRLPGPDCPHRKPAWLIPGVSPIERCKIHRRVELEPDTGLRACPGSGESTRSEVFEFWPSDLLQVFEKAGLPRRIPPPYPPTCSVQRRAEYGRAPEIASPRRDLTYALRSEHSERNRIALEATTDADVRVLYWFVDDAFVGTSDASRTLYWPATPGHFRILAVDDHGRSSARTLHVTQVD